MTGIITLQWPSVAGEKTVLKNFTKLTGKHQGRSLFFNILAGSRHATLFKRNFGTGAFLSVFRKFN